MSKYQKKFNKVSTIVKNNLSLAKIEAKTKNQAVFFETYENTNQNIIILDGFPGVGKTFIAAYKALESVGNGDFNQVLFIKSTVPVRDQGHLPGSAEEKSAPFENPISGIVNQLYNRGDAYSILKKKGTVSFRSTSFEQGDTYTNTVIIIDEPQNMTFKELDLITTRLGKNCRLILCGDDLQDYVTSKKEQSGFKLYCDINKSFGSCELISFDPQDCVRNKLVKNYLIHRENYFKN